jgi:hypothetical protein
MRGVAGIVVYVVILLGEAWLALRCDDVRVLPPPPTRDRAARSAYDHHERLINRW